eukprot:IDg16144t1
MYAVGSEQNRVAERYRRGSNFPAVEGNDRKSIQRGFVRLEALRPRKMKERRDSAVLLAFGEETSGSMRTTREIAQILEFDRARERNVKDALGTHSKRYAAP